MAEGAAGRVPQHQEINITVDWPKLVQNLDDSGQMPRGQSPAVKGETWGTVTIGRERSAGALSRSVRSTEVRILYILLALPSSEASQRQQPAAHLFTLERAADSLKEETICG